MVDSNCVYLQSAKMVVSLVVIDHMSNYQHCMVDPGKHGWWWKPYAKKFPRLLVEAKWTITL